MIKKNIVVFDFDGTITSKDTFNDFLFFSFGRLKVFWTFFLSSPWIVGYLLGRLSNRKVKEHLLQVIGMDMSVNRFNKLATRYAQYRLPKLVKPRALQMIQKYKEEKSTVIIISASPHQWIDIWAKSKDIQKIIASRLETKEKRLTGKFSLNCYGKTKQKEFLRLYPNRKKYSLTVYGDSKGDDELFAIADKIYYRTI